MKKTLLSFLLIVSVLVAMIIPASADTTVLTINRPSLPSVGESFTLTLDISGNPGFNALNVSLGFDHAVVRCDEIIQGTVADGMTFISNPNAIGGAIIGAVAISPATENGTIATFRFTVLATGDPVFTLNGSYITDIDDNKLPLSFAGESIQSDPVVLIDDPVDETPVDPIIPDPVKPTYQTFSDVSASHWSYEFVEKAHVAGYIDGYTDGTFKPSKNMSRAEFVTLLWKMAGKPKPTKNAGFVDVGSKDWYADAVNWAAENGIVKGKTATEFKPLGNITRQEIVLILFNYDGADNDTNPMFTMIYDAMPDSGLIASWAKTSFYWGIYHGIVEGSDNLLKPTGLATRAQVATMIVRYVENQTK